MKGLKNIQKFLAHIEIPFLKRKLPLTQLLKSRDYIAYEEKLEDVIIKKMNGFTLEIELIHRVLDDLYERILELERDLR